jgi:hypothetical protein
MTGNDSQRQCRMTVSPRATRTRAPGAACVSRVRASAAPPACGDRAPATFRVHSWPGAGVRAACALRARGLRLNEGSLDGEAGAYSEVPKVLWLGCNPHGLNLDWWCISVVTVCKVGGSALPARGRAWSKICRPTTARIPLRSSQAGSAGSVMYGSVPRRALSLDPRRFHSR